MRSVEATTYNNAFVAGKSYYLAKRPITAAPFKSDIYVHAFQTGWILECMKSNHPAPHQAREPDTSRDDGGQ